MNKVRRFLFRAAVCAGFLLVLGLVVVLTGHTGPPPPRSAPGTIGAREMQCVRETLLSFLTAVGYVAALRLWMPDAMDRYFPAKKGRAKPATGPITVNN